MAMFVFILLLVFCKIVTCENIINEIDDQTNTTVEVIEDTVQVNNTITVAVLVIGEHRIYDGTWPSHENWLYRPIRDHPTTKQLDVFVCQKKNERLPKVTLHSSYVNDV